MFGVQMTIDEVRKTILEINEVRRDDERAHSREDDLHTDVLRAISAGTAENPREMARLALTTEAIEFHRWCA